MVSKHTNDQSTQTPLNKSAVNPGKLAYGCWRLAGTWDPSAIDTERRHHAEQAVRTAIECGFTTFDHTDIYCEGEAESLFRKIIKNHLSLLDQMIITSKCGIRFARQLQPGSHGLPEHFIKQRSVVSTDRSGHRQSTSLIQPSIDELQS